MVKRELDHQSLVRKKENGENVMKFWKLSTNRIWTLSRMHHSKLFEILYSFFYSVYIVSNIKKHPSTKIVVYTTKIFCDNYRSFLSLLMSNSQITFSSFFIAITSCSTSNRFCSFFINVNSFLIVFNSPTF